jgi:hypothetical protein
LKTCIKVRSGVEQKMRAGAEEIEVDDAGQGK